MPEPDPACSMLSLVLIVRAARSSAQPMGAFNGKNLWVLCLPHIIQNVTGAKAGDQLRTLYLAGVNVIVLEGGGHLESGSNAPTSLLDLISNDPTLQTYKYLLAANPGDVDGRLTLCPERGAVLCAATCANCDISTISCGTGCKIP
jgi:hypothetical protein